MKKITRWKSFDFGPENNNKENVVNNKTLSQPNNSCEDTNSSFCTKVRNKKRNFNFHLQLTPKTVQDLAVHPKKIKEVESWLEFNLKLHRNKKETASFLLISGPTGSGKTATVNVLCKSMNVTVTEWVNPMDQDFELVKGPNQINRFLEFLTDSKWGSLFDDCESNQKIVLVKDFPNAVVHKPEEFFNILENCSYKVNHPVIFICTDASHSGINLSRTLFPQEILTKFDITQISFNPSATTLIQNALKRAQKLVQEHPDLFKLPSASVLEAITATSMGDIRCAMNQFYLSSLIGSEDIPTITEKPSKNGTKRKRTAKNTTTIKSMYRDENLGLFHGLGRVLNPKRKEISDTSWRLNCDVGKLVDEFCVQPGNFTAFLFENYIKYFGDINDVSSAAEILSFSQKFLENWYDRHDTTMVYSIWISILGLMIFNEHKVSKWNQIRGPKKITKRVEQEMEICRVPATDYFYYNLIKKCDKYPTLKY